MQTRCHR